MPEHPFCDATSPHESRKRFLAFPDGYWDQERKEGGAGYVLMGPSGHTHAGAMVPQHIKDELLR